MHAQMRTCNHAYIDAYMHAYIHTHGRLEKGESSRKKNGSWTAAPFAEVRGIAHGELADLELAQVQQRANPPGDKTLRT